MTRPTSTSSPSPYWSTRAAAVAVSMGIEKWMEICSAIAWWGRSYERPATPRSAPKRHLVGRPGPLGRLGEVRQLEIAVKTEPALGECREPACHQLDFVEVAAVAGLTS